MKKKTLGLFICALFLVTSLSAAGQSNNIRKHYTSISAQETITSLDWTEIQKLLSLDNSCEFGCSVSLSGDTAIVGAQGDNDNGNWSGSAYIFTRSGTIWTQQQKILASDGTAGDLFGYSVSVDGDTALIGADWDSDNGEATGSAYVFIRTGTTWTQQAKIQASDHSTGDIFGCSVTLDDNTALIGAAGYDNYRGKVYVFTRTGTIWTQQQILLASDESGGFGCSVSLSGNTALIGALWDSYNGAESGSSYVFTRTSTIWTQQAKLLASDGTAGDLFGHSVSLDGDTAVIGARWDDENEFHAGSAYVFTRIGTTWTQQAKLLAPDSEKYDDFGYSVSLNQNTALIGAYYDDNSKGSAYVFTGSSTNWTLQQKLIASDGAVNAYFGSSVALDGDTALIGAYTDENRLGSAYLFMKEGEDNQRPTSPIINGPARGKIGQQYNYTFNSNDPNGDNVNYYIDWGDGTNTSWIGPNPSGNEIIESHIWVKKGTYAIKAKAKDIFGKESGWGQLSVTMPFSYNIPFQSFWEKIFERFPHVVPILRHMMGY